MSASEFIELHEGKPLEDILILYAEYRQRKIPYDRDIWFQARSLNEKDFCKWFNEEIYAR
jgi:hypothetical protein